MAQLLLRAAPQVYQRAGGHGRGAADLRLTAPGGPGDAGPVGDHRTDAAGGKEGLQHGLLGQVLPPVEGDEYRRQHAAGPRRGGGHHPAHAGVGLAHGQRLGDDLGHELAADGVLGSVVVHELPLSARQAAETAPLAGIHLGGLPHHVPGLGHLGQGVPPGDPPVGHVRLQDDLPEPLALPPGGGGDVAHRIQIHVSPPSCSG